MKELQTLKEGKKCAKNEEQKNVLCLFPFSRSMLLFLCFIFFTQWPVFSSTVALFVFTVKIFARLTWPSNGEYSCDVNENDVKTAALVKGFISLQTLRRRPARRKQMNSVRYFSKAWGLLVKCHSVSFVNFGTKSKWQKYLNIYLNLPFLLVPIR